MGLARKSEGFGFPVSLSMTKKKRPPHKKQRRDMNPDNKKNWKLVCSVCGAEFLDIETIDLQTGHTQEEHPDRPMPEFNLVWVGIGPAPKPRKAK